MTPPKLGRYAIVRELGKGAMGVVYLARDPLIGRELALKTFRVGLATGDEELDQFRARFLREAQSAGILSHPNIVTIHDVVDGAADDAFFIAMEYVQGTDLKRFIQRREPLDLDFVLDVAAQVAEALGYAHSKGVVHRDVKPANIIISGERHVKITDFGIARLDASNLTVEGQLLGTPNYMAPEQIQGKDVDHRADLFSLGVMVYELITKRKPFQGDNLTMVTHRIVYDEHTPPEEFVPSLPEPVRAFLDRALRKKPADRYQSGIEMARELRAIRTRALEAAASATAEPAAPVTPPTPTVVTPAPPTVATPPPPPIHLTPPPVPIAATPPPAPLAFEPPPPLPANPTPAPPPPSVIPTPPPATPSLSASVSSLGAPAAAAAARPSALRLALVAVAAAALGLLLVGSGFLFVREPAERPPSPQEELRLQALPRIQEGRRHLEAGDPAAALEAFDRALAIVPDDREVRRLRDDANRAVLSSEGLDSERSYIEARLGEAAAAQEAKDYGRAVRLADQVLAVDPANERARAIRAESRDAQERRRQVQERLAATARPVTAPPPAPPPPTATAGEATLEIAFHSEISEGILTVYAREQIYKESFRFVEKGGGVFGRGRKTSGSLEATRTLPPGEHSLKVYLYVKGKPTVLREIGGNFPAGVARTLRVRVDAEGALSVSLD